MEGISSIVILGVVIVVAVFILKTVLKVALRIALLAILGILTFLYFTGNLPLPF
ncbi:MAG TPA: hypothetical protein VFC74_04850 [Oscillospiraceae bacterium]|nr:hypothetical protein [Oscillospiraceae bacterium]